MVNTLRFDKSAATNSVTWATMDAKRDDGKAYSIAYVNIRYTKPRFSTIKQTVVVKHPAYDEFRETTTHDCSGGEHNINVKTYRYYSNPKKDSDIPSLVMLTFATDDPFATLSYDSESLSVQYPNFKNSVSVTDTSLKSRKYMTVSINPDFVGWIHFDVLATNSVGTTRQRINIEASRDIEVEMEMILSVENRNIESAKNTTISLDQTYPAGTYRTTDVLFDRAPGSNQFSFAILNNGTSVPGGNFGRIAQTLQLSREFNQVIISNNSSSRKVSFRIYKSTNA